MKKIFVICYDLNFPGKMYKNLDARIEESFPDSVRVLESTWLVASSLNTDKVLQSLQKAVDSNDKVLVIPVTPVWASLHLDPEHVQWLQSHLSA